MSLINKSLLPSARLCRLFELDNVIAKLRVPWHTNNTVVQYPTTAPPKLSYLDIKQISGTWNPSFSLSSIQEIYNIIRLLELTEYLLALPFHCNKIFFSITTSTSWDHHHHHQHHHTPTVKFSYWISSRKFLRYRSRDRGGRVKQKISYDTRLFF